MARFRTSIFERRLAWLALLAAASSAAADGASTPDLGKPAGVERVRSWDLSVYPDGRGLPAGAGSAAQGAPIYRSRCARCHGADGEGGSGGTLAGRGSLTDPDPDQTVGNYWPYATTLFDYTRRAMPIDAPGTLSDADVYAVSAYVLYMNRIVGLDDRLDAQTLPRIRMPNRDGFIGVDAQWPVPDSHPPGR
jgi:mono/diheme cytochrome c family protein